jgi:hypothetical protein
MIGLARELQNSIIPNIIENQIFNCVSQKFILTAEFCNFL